MRLSCYQIAKTDDTYVMMDMKNITQAKKVVEMLSYNELPMKMYSLLFLEPRTVTGLSDAIYGKKRQLSQINRVMKKFRSYGLITDHFVSKDKLTKDKLDPRLHFWKAKSTPFIYYWNETLKSRKADAKLPSSHYTLDKKDAEVLELLLDSKWFRQLLEKEYSLEGNHNKIEGRYFLEPLESVTRVIGQIGAISLAYHMGKVLKTGVRPADIIKKNNFDEFIAEENRKLNEQTKTEIQYVLENALDYLGRKKKPYIADYYNLFLNDSGAVFIPFSLADKLAGLGRIEITLLEAFDRRGANERPY